MEIKNLLDLNVRPLSLTQDQFIEYCNDRDVVMISAPDSYEIGKNGDKKTIDGLQKDFDESSIVTSTRNFYKGNSLKGNIIHNYGSNIIKPYKSKTILIPVLQGVTLEDGLEDERILNYVQTLYNTKDNKKTIKQSSENLSGLKSSKIKFYTPSLNSNEYTTRKENPERVVWFDCSDGGFHVFGDDLVGGIIGRSCEVLLSTAGAKKFSELKNLDITDILKYSKKFVPEAVRADFEKGLIKRLKQ